MSNLADLKNKARNIVNKYYPTVECAILTGSQLEAEFVAPTSDIDIVIISKKFSGLTSYVIKDGETDNGGTPNSEEIDKTLEKIAGPKQPGGYSLSSDDFKAAIDEYFDTYKPNNQNELKGLIDEGKDAFARIDTNGDGSRDHAVILTDSDDGGFYYYDPVIGTDNNYIENSGVHDPLVINGSK